MQKPIEGEFRVLGEGKQIKPIDGEKVVLAVSHVVVLLVFLAVMSVIPLHRAVAWMLYDHQPSHFTTWANHAHWDGKHWVVPH